MRKEIFEKPGGTFVLVKTHTFIYDGWNVIEERQFNSSGTLTALTRITWGADVSGSMQGAGGVGGLLMTEEIDLADIDPPTAHYYWYDGNGNVTGITDATGAIEGTYRYTSFGALAESTTTTPFAIAQPWKFSTKYHDPEVEPVAGTYYYGYRSYLPSVGRWPSRDPIGESGGLNLYGMVANSAIGLSDTLGLCPDCSKGCCEIDGKLIPCIDLQGGSHVCEFITLWVGTVENEKIPFWAILRPQKLIYTEIESGGNVPLRKPLSSRHFMIGVRWKDDKKCECVRKCQKDMSIRLRITRNGKSARLRSWSQETIDIGNAGQKMTNYHIASHEAASLTVDIEVRGMRNACKTWTGTIGIPQKTSLPSTLPAEYNPLQ